MPFIDFIKRCAESKRTLKRVNVSNVFTVVFAHHNHDMYITSKESMTRH